MGSKASKSEKKDDKTTAAKDPKSQDGKTSLKSGKKQDDKVNDLLGQIDSGEMMQLFQYERAPSAIVHHFLSSNLPMMPVFSPAYLNDCVKTWKTLLTGSTERMKEFSKPGIVLVYDEFFFRLLQRDQTFEDVFPTIQSRASNLIKTITVIMKSTADNNAQLINKIRYLGHRHRYFPGIRPHQFSTFTLTLIEVIMYWLSEFATPDIAEAWSNCICFYTKYMLEAMLSNRVDPFEQFQNTNIDAIREISASETSKSRSQSSADHTGRSQLLTGRASEQFSARNSARSQEATSARA